MQIRNPHEIYQSLPTPLIFIHGLVASLPLLVFVLIVIGIGVLRKKISGLRLPGLKWLGIGITSLLILIASAYLVIPVLGDESESLIASISGLAFRGAAIYPSLDSAARYITLYGPICYFSKFPFFFLFGPSLFATKMPGYVSLLASLLSIYYICRYYVNSYVAGTVVGFVSLVLLRFGTISFGIRSDPLLLACTSVPLLCILRGGKIAAPIAMGLSLALMPNLKVTALIYLLPTLVFYILRRGWKSAVISLGIGLALLPLPFLPPQVSMANYLEILHVIQRHGFSADMISRNLQYSIILLVPVLALLFTRLRTDAQNQGHSALYVIVVVASMGMISILSGKPGSESYHLIPFLASLSHSYAWLYSDSVQNEAYVGARWWALPCTLTVALYTLLGGQGLNLVNSFRSVRRSEAAIHEIRDAERQFSRENVEVGFGSDFEDRVTWMRPLLVFDGQPLTIDRAALRDLQFGGIDIPDKTLNYFSECGSRVWLIPSASQPFLSTNTYYARKVLVAEPLHRSFVQNYHRVRAGTVFDVWYCNR